MKPYALKAGDGWTYRYGIDFTVKAGELRHGRGATLTEYTTRRGEEPPDHTHDTEDELFYVLDGDLTFRCGEQHFHVERGGFVYLPRGIEHGYRIPGDAPVRLLVVSFPVLEPAGGWNGFLADVERDGEVTGVPQP
ncbi:quercetin dioxygenase-like cupin family protein [Deinococcus metalli]|uniref:Quercetin dioxygenase-like cupin family protein n=1 Tax=Deinococcus metalli TaxID=1141878 RepID=A0A7W8NLX5_9DEIO|nr:cupin domain-containing protein [Deinococcus metalli]MBB5375154.1 quercetin dioxygenase-like cupin family protein [Deinococcus metalli]GHF31296.1 hypothetical protein GCM10017781_04440 [Deinococcus metalli]